MQQAKMAQEQEATSVTPSSTESNTITLGVPIRLPYFMELCLSSAII